MYSHHPYQNLAGDLQASGGVERNNNSSATNCVKSDIEE